MIATRILQGNAAPVTTIFYNDETPVGVGSVTVTVTDPDGATVSTGTATLTGTTYSYTVPAQTGPKPLTIAWAAAARAQTTYAEVVGGFWFELADLRAYSPLIADGNTFPTTKLLEARTKVEDAIEKAIGFSGVPRWGRTTTSGRGIAPRWGSTPRWDRFNSTYWDVNTIFTDTIFTRHQYLRSLTAVSVDGTALTPSDFVVFPGGHLVYQVGTIPTGDRNVVATYTHGLSAPPGDLVECALRLGLVAVLDTKNSMMDRAVTVTNEAGTFTIGQANDEDRPFGIPEVDAVIVRHRKRRLVVV